MKVIKIAVTAVAVLSLAASMPAQDRKPIPADEMSKYVVSAKPGVVSIVEGAATVTRALPFAAPEMLISGDELRAGDTVSTGSGSRAEILLDPGCYLRLGQASELVFLFDGYSDNKIKLSRGSAVVEASAIDGFILVETPKAKFEITRNGLYRFNVAGDGRTEVAVRKGRLLAGEVVIKEGKKAIVQDGTPTIAALNKKELDDLDDWSKERARTLIATNKKLSSRTIRRSLAMGFSSNAWIYDQFCGCYTFLPLMAGFASPYGWSYSVCNPYWPFLWGGHYNDGNHYRRPGGGNGGPSSGGGQAGGTPGHGHPGRGGVHPPPPRIEPAGRGFQSHDGGLGRGASQPAPSHEGGSKKH